MKRDPEYFVSSAQPLDRYLKLRSSGSTGAPRTVYHDGAALLQNAAHGERNRSLLTPRFDRSLGYRVTAVYSSVYVSPFTSGVSHG